MLFLELLFSEEEVDSFHITAGSWRSILVGRQLTGALWFALLDCRRFTTPESTVNSGLRRLIMDSSVRASVKIELVKLQWPPRKSLISVAQIYHHHSCLVKKPTKGRMKALCNIKARKISKIFGFVWSTQVGARILDVLDVSLRLLESLDWLSSAYISLRYFDSLCVCCRKASSMDSFVRTGSLEMETWRSITLAETRTIHVCVCLCDRNVLNTGKVSHVVMVLPGSVTTKTWFYLYWRKIFKRWKYHHKKPAHSLQFMNLFDRIIWWEVTCKSWPEKMRGFKSPAITSLAFALGGDTGLIFSSSRWEGPHAPKVFTQECFCLHLILPGIGVCCFGRSRCQECHSNLDGYLLSVQAVSKFGWNRRRVNVAYACLFISFYNVPTPASITYIFTYLVLFYIWGCKLFIFLGYKATFLLSLGLHFNCSIVIFFSSSSVLDILCWRYYLTPHWVIRISYWLLFSMFSIAFLFFLFNSGPSQQSSFFGFISQISEFWK